MVCFESDFQSIVSPIAQIKFTGASLKSLEIRWASLSASFGSLLFDWDVILTLGEFGGTGVDAKNYNK